jgi:hypothetical protein
MNAIAVVGAWILFGKPSLFRGIKSAVSNGSGALA